MWDYPRPPRLERSAEMVVVTSGDVEVARTRGSLRILETSHPPTYYVPPSAVAEGVLRPAGGGSFCEWKGLASYFDVVVGGAVVAERAAWTYPEPSAAFAELADHVAFYPALLRCEVDGELVRPQPGGFYGGWITDRVVGPFKGEPGTLTW